MAKAATYTKQVIAPLSQKLLTVHKWRVNYARKKFPQARVLNVIIAFYSFA